MKIQRALGTMAVMAVVAPLGFGIPTSVGAADFYVFPGTAAYEMVVIDPGEIQNLANGNRVTSLWYVTVDMTQNLDVSKVEMDCASPRFRVIAETLFLGFHATAEQIDKTRVNSKDWRPIGDGATFKEYQSFVCAWPTVDGQVSMTQFPDIWSMTKAAADFLWGEQMKDRQRQEKP